MRRSITLAVGQALLGTVVAGTVAVAATAAELPRTEVPAQQRTQVPGYYRMVLGDFEVTALYDGYVDIDQALLSGASAEDIQSLLARMFIADPQGVQTAVNAYIVHTGSRLVLVDTGAARSLGPTMGFVLDNIRAAGYDPARIDAVLLTHLHPDHAMGLLNPDGRMAFPNAEVQVSKAECDYWLSEAVAASAPKESRPFFGMVREAVAPYVAAGRFKAYGPGETLLPGVAAVPTPGHTPGHAAYLFTSKGQSLLVWGDIVHSHATQFIHPEIAIEFDLDQRQAVATRRRIFADAAEQQLWIAGAHLPFPGIGHVRAERSGYAWVPIEYRPIDADR